MKEKILFKKRDSKEILKSFDSYEEMKEYVYSQDYQFLLELINTKDYYTEIIYV